MERLKYLLGIFAAGVLVAANTGGGNRALQMKAIGRTPLSFQQIDQKNGAWMASGRGYKVVLDSGAAAIELNSGKDSAAVEMRLMGANSGAASEAQQPLPGKVNYLIGPDPKRWRTGLSTFGRIKYHEVYRNTDVIWYGNQGELEYDFQLRPGSDPALVTLGFNRATKLEIEPNGDLRIGVGDRHITLRAPSIYQEIAGVRKNISGHYELRTKNEVSFRIGSYDKSSTLVIDPSIAYSSYYGSDLTPGGIAVDTSGNVYVGGGTYNGTISGGSDTAIPTAGLGSESGVVTKFNSSGTVVWSTFIGGSGQDAIYGIAVDSGGDVVATGSATSTDFPVVSAAQATANGTNNAFALKLNANGTELTYSTYMGGSQGDEGSGIALDSSGNAYITGTTYANAFLGASTGSTAGEAFVVKLSSAGSLATHFPLFVGTKTQGNAITADLSGAYVTGGIGSGGSFSNGPTLGPQSANHGGYDAFIMKVTSAGYSSWATFLGGSGDETGNAIVSDGTNLYVAGWTSSSNLPVVSALPGESSLKGSVNAFVASIDLNGTAFRFVTYLGGSNYDIASGLALDPSGALVVVGNTGSSDFPTTNAIEPVFPSDASLLYYSSNQGATWTPSHGLGTAYFLSNISPDPSNAGTIVAVEAANGSNSVINGIVYSTTNGQTWQTAYQSANPIYSLARNPSNPNVLYAIDSSNTILRSTDSGVQWTNTGTTVASYNSVISVTKAGTILVFGTDSTNTSNRVFRSTDGQTFTAVTPGLSSTTLVTPLYAVFDIDGSPSGAAYVGVSYQGSSGTMYGIYRSTDDGQTWTFLNSAPATANNLTIGKAQGGVPPLYAADCTSVYTSTDGGNTWAVVSQAAGLGICYVASSSGTASTFGATQGGDVYVSGTNPWSLAGSIDNNAITGIAVDASGNNVYLKSEATAQSGFVTSMATNGSAINWSTYFGDSDGSTLSAVAPHTSEGVWVTGQGSLNLPLSSGANETNGLEDASSSFIAQLSNSTPSCTYSINPNTSQWVYATGTLYFSVTSPSNCSWSAASSAGWVTFDTGTSGTGSGTGAVRVQGNTTDQERSATITVQSQSFTISEPPMSCTYALQSGPALSSETGGTVSLQILGSSPNVGTTCPDIPPIPVSGYPIGQVTGGGGSYSVDLPANPSVNAQRFELQVGGQTVTIYQASTCQYTGFPTGTLTLSALAGGGTIGPITASPAACGYPYPAFSDSPQWLTVTSSSTAGTITYSYTGNYTGASRTGHIILNGQSYALQQSPASALQFVPITPCRIVDTRYGTGTFGGPTIGAGANGIRTFPLLQSTTCTGIPPHAAAFSLNVTAVPHGFLGYITIWPSDRTQPVVSTLNSQDGRIKADAVIVPGSADGRGSVSIYAQDETDIILDLNGYFVPVTDSNPSALAFYPITPCRVVDTRYSSSVNFPNYAPSFGSPSFTDGQTRDFPIASSACLSSIPVGTHPQAYSLNFTVSPTSALGAVGYLTTWPADAPTMPVVSTLDAQLVDNPLTAPIVANAAIVKAATTSGSGFGVGDIKVFTQYATDVIIDINGYFAPSGTGGLSFYSATPCRAYDSAQLPTATQPSGTLTVYVGNSPCTPPSTAQAYVFNATVEPYPFLGYLALWSDDPSQSQPVVSTLDALDAYIVSNMAIVPTSSGNVKAFVQNPSVLILDYNGFFAP